MMHFENEMESQLKVTTGDKIQSRLDHEHKMLSDTT